MDVAGINATDLSKLSGVGKGDISHYLNGHYIPKQDKCYYLAKALNIDPGWLMIGYEPSPFDMQEEQHDPSEDILNLYNSLSDEGKLKAKSYLEFLKSQEGTV